MRAGHAFALNDPDATGARVAAGGAAPSAWAEIDRIWEEMLWSRLDAAFTANALARVVAAVSWTTLALVTGADASWGIGMVLGGCLSLLHARRRTVLLIADNAGPLAPAVRWLLPYPRVPHINPVGLIEGAGLIVASVGTGRLGDAFAGTPAAVAAAPAALALLVLYIVGVIVNLTSHVAWEIGPVSAFYRRVRPYLAPAFAVTATGLLWPDRNLGAAYPAAVAIVVLGAVCIVLAGQAAAAFLASTARRLSNQVGSVRRTVQAVDGAHVHQLKNMARIVYRRSGEITSGDLRERIRRLCVAISSTEQMFKSGQGQSAQCVEEVVNGLLGLDERFEALRHVDADLDLRDLTAGDAELVAIAVGDLCSNAVNAGASRFRVGLRADPAEHGTWLTLEAECVCGRSLPDVPEDSSLMRLATLLHYNRGTFVISDGEGSHRFTLRWPSTARPGALTVVAGPAAGPAADADAAS